MIEKKIVGEKAVEFVKDGMTVGLGTGSTVYYTIIKLGQLMKEGLTIKGVPTSVETEKLAIECGIPLANIKEIDQIDVAIDGADEVDSQLNLMKGGGGALLREKIIARAAKKFIVVADPAKIVNHLGAFPLPIEVVPFGVEMTNEQIRLLGAETKIRYSNGNPYQSDNGNYIIDAKFPNILNPVTLEQKLNMIPGVVENGLFNQMANAVITLNAEKSVVIKNRS
ncbi:ribose-5-phosphate isomerase RpiA [Peribacillus loiseleuriae]|uniref:Ribose-5-phosphate isomerase A n=1 Tax=Peribacillus loiseleuriae TaxID=1679170 RepID=A0A0K9GW10_9BACI|nr:ribose-5-phosphate isomerase RpiA [Peribacillus loiseleuriae]KMY50821.1 ribose 5-phosphate isomerase [Peribacillus loiseleuriae]